MLGREYHFPSDRIRYSNRIFTSRNLRLDSIEAIGFDMDYTLVLYTEAVEILVAEMALKLLVQDFDYPKEILKIDYDPSFPVRGLVLDKRLGNIFKMDGHQHVQRVHHGLKRYSREKRHKTYRNTVIRPSISRYQLVDTLFELPELYLYARLVEWIDSTVPRKDRKASYTQLYEDLRQCIDRVHRDGSLKSQIVADPARFIERDPAIARTLAQFITAGKKLFLLTNSEWEYTVEVMSFLLDGELPGFSSWRDYFDVVVSFAMKPRFFQERRPFVQVDPPTQAPVTELLRGRAYSGGNLKEFEKMTGWKGDSVLYVGDHIYGDVLRSKKTAGWRTALILPEMEEELRRTEAAVPYLTEREGLERARQGFEDELSYQVGIVKRLESSEEFLGLGAEERGNMLAQARHKIEILEEQLVDNEERMKSVKKRMSRYFNAHWGRLFRADVEHSSFGAQVARYACVYTSRVSNFFAYAPTQYFQTPEDRMPHERWELY